MVKATQGGKGFLGLHFHTIVHHWRKSGQELKQNKNLQAGADAEVMEGAANWLPLPGLLSLLPYRTKNCNGLGPQPFITK